VLEFWLYYGLAISVIAFLLAGVLFGVVRVKAVSRLKAMHASTWDELGRPPTLAIHPKQYRNLTKFVARGAYKALDDPKLSFMCRLAYIFGATHYVALILAFTWPLVVLIAR
jgi:hypothetical protein